MSDDLTRLYLTTTADAERMISGIAPGQLDAPTPCDGWDVRTLLNHLVGGNKFFLARATGAADPSRADDFLGADPLGAFRASAAELTEVFTADGFADRPVSTPLGDGVGSLLIAMRVNEFLLHGWDLAVATGQPRDFDPDVVAFAGRALHARELPRGEGRMFGDERAVPDGASAVDALAGFMGRRVPA